MPSIFIYYPAGLPRDPYFSGLVPNIYTLELDMGPWATLLTGKINIDFPIGTSNHWRYYLALNEIK